MNELKLTGFAKSCVERERTHFAEACRYALLLGGVAHEMTKLKKSRAYVRWCEDEVGMGYRQVLIRRKAWEEFIHHHKAHGLELETFVVNDASKSSRLINSLDAFISDRSFNRLQADLGLAPSRKSYTQAKKTDVASWRQLVEVCQQHLEELPKPVREVLEKM